MVFYHENVKKIRKMKKNIIFLRKSLVDRKKQRTFATAFRKMLLQ